MQTNRNIMRIVCQTTLGLMVSSAGLAWGQAATATPDQAPAKAPLLLASASAPVDLGLNSAFAYSSSSSAVTEAAALEKFDLSGSLGASQPPPRRRYGRPNYSDSHTNPDGSSKFAFMAGGGITIPTSDTSNYLNPNYVFQVGAGRNFSKMYGLLAQFDYNRFGFTGATLGNQQAVYNAGCTAALQNSGQCSLISGLDGTSHVWSFTLDPTVTFYGSGSTGLYAVGGVGFYHKTANFTIPATGLYCDPYYGCYQYQANETIDKYTSNAIGFNGGLGMTYKPSRFAGERFYAEARFVYVANNPKAYSPTNNNYYPPNSNHTTYVPITFGLRF